VAPSFDIKFKAESVILLMMCSLDNTKTFVMNIGETTTLSMITIKDVQFLGSSIEDRYVKEMSEQDHYCPCM
jgi:hypothetical protein